MSRHIESNPRGQRGLRRVDVDICERGRPIWVHGRSAEVVEDKEATKEAGVGSRGGGGELGHVRIISYNIQVSILITFHRFLIVNYRVRCVASRRFLRAQGTASRRCRHMRMQKGRTKSEFEAVEAPARVFERGPPRRVASSQIPAGKGVYVVST
jgi:hypothetical protein